MAAIRGANTKPEMIIRRGLHARGFRFRLHDRKLIGRPDLVFPKHHAVLFVHGCFWHGHDCHLFKWPKTRAEFWRKKIGSNVLRDKTSTDALHQAGWRVAVVWECALKGRHRRPVGEILDAVSGWLTGRGTDLTIAGQPKGRPAEPVR